MAAFVDAARGRACEVPWPAGGGHRPAIATMSARRSIPGAAHVGTWVAVTLVAVLAVAWVVALELVVTAAWLHPIGWALALAPAALFVVVTCTPPWATKPRARWLSAVSLLLGALVVLVPWNGRKQFVHDVFSVRVGMTVDEVETVMAGYIKGAGPHWQMPEEPGPRAAPTLPPYREPEYPSGPARRHFTGTMTYRWSTAASYNADWGLVHFVDGKVAKLEFLAD